MMVFKSAVSKSALTLCHTQQLPDSSKVNDIIYLWWQGSLREQQVDFCHFMFKHRNIIHTERLSDYNAYIT